MEPRPPAPREDALTTVLRGGGLFMLLEIGNHGHGTFESQTATKEMNIGLYYRHSECLQRLIWRQNRSEFSCTCLLYYHTIQN